METPRQVELRIRNLRRHKPAGHSNRSKFEPGLQVAAIAPSASVDVQTSIDPPAVDLSSMTLPKI
jgi:hypothetical protein